MIVKILAHKRPAFKQLLEYMLRNKDRMYDDKGNSFAITHNLMGNNIGAWVKQYQENETHRNIRRKNSVKLTHEIISFHKDDTKNITLAKMEDIAREYMKQRNPKGMYVAVPHFDKKHFHIHLLCSGLEFHTGKSLHIGRPELQTLKRDIQKYQIQKYPELSHSIVAHGGKNDKVKTTDKEYQLKSRTGRESEKETVMGVIKTCYKKANSKETFFQLLNESGLKTYERGGRTYGVVFNERNFRFKTLGFSEERLTELDKAKHREYELLQQRNSSTKEKGIER